MRLKHRPLCGVGITLVIVLSFMILITGEKWIPGLMESSLDRHWSEGDSITLTGLVYDLGKGETYRKVYLKEVVLYDDVAKSKYREEKILVYVKNNVPSIGEVVHIKGTLSFFQEARNPGNFNQKVYYQKQNIHGMVKGSQIEGLQDLCEKSLWWRLKRNLRSFRDSWQENLLEVLGETDGSVLSAMLLGEKSGMDQQVKDIYQANGIAHILAISSLHLMFVGGNMYRGLRRLTGSYQMGGLFGILFLWLYILMVGITVSAVRSLVMFLFQVGAAMAGRKYDIPTAYVTALFVVILWRPLSLYDGGFYMSFGAVFAVLFVTPILFGKPKKSFSEKHKKHWGEGLKESFRVSVAIQLTMFPILLYYYYECSPLSLLLNLVVIPLMSLLLGSGMIGSFFLVILKPLGVSILWICKAILVFYRVGGEKTLLLPGSRWVVGQPRLWQMAVYYGLFCMILIWRFRDNRIKEREETREETPENQEENLPWKTEKRSRKEDWTVGRMIRGSLLGVSFLLLLVRPEEIGHMRVMFLDVGQGDCIFIKSPEGLRILVDGGSSDVTQAGRYRIEPYLKNRGVGILDYVFVSHGDLDHMNGIEELIDRQKFGVRIKNLVLPEKIYWDDTLKTLAEKADLNGIEVWTFSQGKKIVDRKGTCEITCLGPGDKKIEAGNEASMVLKVSCNEKNILLTGDVEADGEKALIKVLRDDYQDVRWDLLKVAHHGSKNSTGRQFLDVVEPTEAIISAGVNNSYGHPHKETLDALKEAGCIIRSTKDQGGIEYLF